LKKIVGVEQTKSKIPQISRENFKSDVVAILFHYNK